MVGPKYHAPAPPRPSSAGFVQGVADAVQDTDGWKVAQPQDAMLHGKWWEIYNDPELNALEDKLNIDNQNIKQFFENFMESRTLVAQSRAQLYPTVGTTPSYFAKSQLRKSEKYDRWRGNQFGATSNLFTLPATVSWEPDLWGRVRNTVRESQYNAQVSAADLENIKLSEQASLRRFTLSCRVRMPCKRFLPTPLKRTKER